jgi:hypothetical protein
MGYDVFTKRCGCGAIHPVRTTCGSCISLRRAEAVAKAGPEQKRFSGTQWYVSSLKASAFKMPPPNEGVTVVGPWLTVRADPNMPRDTAMLVPALGGFVDMSAPVSSAEVFRREQQYQRELGNLPMLSDMQPEKPAKPKPRSTVEKLRDAMTGMPAAEAYDTLRETERRYGVRGRSAWCKPMSPGASLSPLTAASAAKERYIDADCNEVREALGGMVEDCYGQLRRIGDTSPAVPGPLAVRSGRQHGKQEAMSKADAMEKWCRDMGIPVR